MMHVIEPNPQEWRGKEQIKALMTSQCGSSCSVLGVPGGVSEERGPCSYLAPSLREIRRKAPSWVARVHDTAWLLPAELL